MQPTDREPYSLGFFRKNKLDTKYLENDNLSDDCLLTFWKFSHDIFEYRNRFRLIEHLSSILPCATF